MPLLWPDLPPSLLLTSSTPYLLFGVTHALVTRTIVNRLVPKETGLKWEGLASVFDGLVRPTRACTPPSYAKLTPLFPHHRLEPSSSAPSSSTTSHGIPPCKATGSLWSLSPGSASRSAHWSWKGARCGTFSGV